MTLYFLHLFECGDLTTDGEGSEYDDLEEARTSAIVLARGVMIDEVRRGRVCLSCSIKVHDAQGVLVLTVPFREALIVDGL